MARKPLRDLARKQLRRRLKVLLKDNSKTNINRPNNPSTSRQTTNHDQVGMNKLPNEIPQATNIMEIEDTADIEQCFETFSNGLYNDNSDNVSDEENFETNVQQDENESKEDEYLSKITGTRNDNIPLYNRGQITLKESMLAILSLVLKHNLSMTCIGDIINVIELHCPQKGLQKNSLYKFQKFFGINVQTFQKHFFCSLCKEKKETGNEICEKCLSAPKAYFIELPIISHIQKMYKRRNFFHSLQKGKQGAVENNIISDIYDGRLYREWKNKGFLSNPHNISFSWYIDEVNNRLQKIKPPKFIHRMPRSINDLTHWKASEFKNFFFYYSLAVFDGIMKPHYFKHYLKLVAGVSILCADKIHNAQIDVADDLLNAFVRQFEKLYDVKYCSINIHLLLHLANCVRELGPLWAYTCYEYENINGEMSRSEANVDKPKKSKLR